MDMFLFFLPGPEMAEFRLGWVLHPAKSLENMLSRQEIEWRVCMEKILTKKINLRTKIEYFFSNKVASLPNLNWTRSILSWPLRFALPGFGAVPPKKAGIGFISKGLQRISDINIFGEKH